MPKDWKTTVSKANKKAYAIPDGWSTESEVAKDLGCPVSRVKTLLKPGITNGDIEKSMFPIWCEQRQGPVRTACYRPVPESATVPDGRRGRKKTPVEDRIADCINRHPDWDDQRVAGAVRGARQAVVQEIRSEIEEKGDI